MVEVLLIGGGGFAGALARYLVDGRVVMHTGTALPWGTLVINVGGSFAAGLLFSLIAEQGVLPAALIAPLLIGFLGSFTTFSTLTLESWRLAQQGAWRSAGLNLGGSIVAGLLAVAAGLFVGRLA